MLNIFNINLINWPKEEFCKLTQTLQEKGSTKALGHGIIDTERNERGTKQ
jgi:hypothetical protein